MKKKRLEQVFSKKGWEKPGKLNECAVLYIEREQWRAYEKKALGTGFQ
jgi:hypothetical protein